MLCKQVRTALERLDSSDDESEDDDAGPAAAGGAGASTATASGATERLIAQHVQEYVRERISGKRAKDPLAWWSRNHARWPMVAAVARHSLCVPAAAACSERSFSRTGNIVRSRRARLSDVKIEELSHLCCAPED